MTNLKEISRLTLDELTEDDIKILFASDFKAYMRETKLRLPDLAQRVLDNLSKYPPYNVTAQSRKVGLFSIQGHITGLRRGWIYGASCSFKARTPLNLQRTAIIMSEAEVPRDHRLVQLGVKMDQRFIYPPQSYVPPMAVAQQT